MPADPQLTVREVGRVRSISQGVARVDGLVGTAVDELVRFGGGRLGVALDLEPDQVGVVLLDDTHEIVAGDEVRRTRRVLDVPVGEGLAGRVIDPAGRPLDGGGRLRTAARLPVQRPAPAIMDRAGVERPLQTGLKVVDALIPIGRGQRELILGDRQTGKTAVAVDAICNQAGQGVRCVYCAIGQRQASVAQVVADLRARGAMEYTTVVVAGGEHPVGLQYAAPYAATSVAEHLMELGHDVLVVYDDLTRHARAYRELALLLRRPPGREAYPGDVFYLHARLLERATQLRPSLGGGSLTALPIVETQAEDLAAYIPTNLISITDGQVYLSPRLFRQGQFPAVDVGRSVSRVGGKAQLPAYRAVAGDLRLAYAQFEELERFTRYGARLEDSRRRQLERGRRVREVLKQRQFRTLSVPSQLAELIAVTDGLLDDVAPERIDGLRPALHDAVAAEGDLVEAILAGESLTADARARLRDRLAERVGGDRDGGG
ncbi:MAG: F0F1 ATP synthase subunit alpha [Actinomycetota bacterium]|nr:F0F1 ATP synthase subunit alpha [Actinomycetota bacterium]